MEIYNGTYCVYIHTNESVMEASRQTGINDGNISRCCNGHTRTAGGYIWLFCN